MAVAAESAEQMLKGGGGGGTTALQLENLLLPQNLRFGDDDGERRGVSRGLNPTRPDHESKMMT